MQKKNSKANLAVLIIAAIIELTVAVFTLLYVFNTFDLQTKLLPEVLGYITLGVTFLDAILCLILVLAINKVKEKTDIKMSDVVGADIKEAYMFGKIGLVVVNEDGIVLWENDLLLDRQINIISRNIFEWYPKLKDFLNQDVGDKITINQNNMDYEVKYLKAAGLFIFRDITDYEYLYRYTKEQATCVGIVMIDNYADIVGNTDVVNEVISSVRDIINAYAKKYNCLLRPYRNDAYFVICNFQSLSDMKKDGFSLIDDVRHLQVKETIQPTLSIGFAHDFPDVNKLNEMASNAIDIAMSRGGDQVVVSKYGSELEFFGGKSEAVEVGNKVKVRVFSDSLISLINRASNVIIMGHKDMDMDALGACLGVKAICDACGKEAYIVFDPKLTELKTRTAFTSLFTREQVVKLAVTPREAIDLVKQESVVVVCDISRPTLTMCPKILEQTDKIVIIDHHRRATEFIENPVLFNIEPGSSSSSELVAEMVKYNSRPNKIPLDPTFATIMLSGIFLDTGFFKSKTTGLRTFEASMILKEYGADNALADDLLKDEYEEYALVNKIISTLKTPYYGVCYCVCEEDEIIEQATLAKVANQCIQFKGINACFVIGKTTEDTVRISARSDGTVNVQILMERMNGGGHYSMAAAAIKDSTVKKTENALLEVLQNYLGEARSKKEDTKGS
jgi:Predicted signaling protein consisting of a modified GGDEF domain and a DHH domain